MVDLRQDLHTDQPTEYFALCSEHIEASCFSRSVLIGTPVDFKKFYLEKGSVPSIYAKPNRFFPEKCSLDVSLGPYQETSVSNPPPPPQKKKHKQKFIYFFSVWEDLFEICSSGSSDMTDPRPCPPAWAYFRIPSRSTKTCQAQTNNKLLAAKIGIFTGQRNITGQNTPSPNVYRMFLGKKMICPESCPNNINAS